MNTFLKSLAELKNEKVQPKSGGRAGRFGLLGGSLGHSFSPRIHGLLADYSYELFERTEGELAEFFEREGLQGVNVTIPYKKVMIKYCDELSETAERIGSVNTIVRRGGTIKGFNTDYAGFIYLCRSYGIEVCGREVVVLGNGGALRAVLCALDTLGAKSVTVLSRRVDEKSELHYTSCSTFLDSYARLSDYTGADILVNTTPVGMFPTNGKCPVDIDAFHKLEAVVDIIYNPLHTELLLKARDKGIKTANGMSMLVAQAACSSELFQERIADEKEFLKVFDGAFAEKNKAGHLSDTASADASKALTKRLSEITDILTLEHSNIILIGMPGCGKTTLGRKLSAETGRVFMDTDEEITKLTGMSPAEYIETRGEESFREIESDVLRMAVSFPGRVIATGGGIVTRKENFHPMQENGHIIYIDTPLSRLATEGRPLSKEKGLEALFRERENAYFSLADEVYENYETTNSSTSSMMHFK